ncbi:MAG: hypothetical protein F4113_06190 [Rhodothermaceae bacterium]|nr:hypothetical protein [Rhodothermaceae bacterium]
MQIRAHVRMRGITFSLALMIFCLSPLSLLAQRMVITPADVTVYEGTSVEFTVVLSSAPTGDVTVTIVRPSETDLSLDKTFLTFTPTNWNVPQQVTMMAGEDADFADDADRLILIASGVGYGGGGGVMISPETSVMRSLGETVQLATAVQDQNGDPITGVDLEWTSDDPSIAVVDSVGKVTAVNFGLTVVTAALSTASGTATILVDDPNDPSVSDREILEILFNATGGENWRLRDGWLTDAPLNEWSRVETDAEGNVTELWLTRNNLEGPLPPSLGLLRNLEVLALYSNRLSGPIPPELGNLTQLKELLLPSNELSGPIPPEFGNLTQLEELVLYSNELSGPVAPELGNLTQLEELSLSSNELSGPIPPELGNLRQLKKLTLSRNKLSGPIPPQLGNLAQLEDLWLFRNELSGSIPPELGNLKQLKELQIGTNPLSGPIPPELGSLTQLKELLIPRSKLSGSIPPELGNLVQLEYLWLFRTELTGSIPPELGNLKQLKDLTLSRNRLSGPIPPEVGNLEQLLTLDLYSNPGLEGLLPRSFIGLGVEYLNVRDTRVCGHQDAVFLEWWRNIPSGRIDNCAPGLIERLTLIELYNKMKGASWTNAAGWGSNSPLEDWYGVTVEEGRVTELSLPNNAIKGSIQGEVANLTQVEVFNLANNALIGSLPGEISLLRELTELRVNGNTDLEGIFGRDLTKLDKLEVLHFEGTLICASPAPMFQAWYAGIGDVNGVICGNPPAVRLSVPAAYLTQSIQTLESSVRLVSGRDALLRVFVTGDSGPAFFEHKVIATIRSDSGTHQFEMTRPDDRLAVKIDESDLSNSFNALIPGDFIIPGATLVVEADPEGVIPRAVGSQDRFPVTGQAPLNVVSVPDMEVTVVPVLEATQPDRSIFTWTNNISDDSPEVGLLKYAFPFHRFHARSRGEYVTSLDLVSDDGQWGLVLELEALRLLDDATGYYYGAAASVNGYVRGRARLGGWASIGKAWDTELAHEVGHNLDLRHAPCGGAGSTDPDFPHSDGSVGVWGFDFRDSTLISPTYHKDIMGYCYDQGWLSDYFYENVIDYREQVEGKREQPFAEVANESDMLVLWGGVRGGELRIEPLFSASVAAQLPEVSGPYHLEGFGGNVSLFSLSFTPGEDKFGDKYFLFAIPVEQDWEGSLDRIVLTGPEGSVTIGADDQRTLSVFRDASTGEVRGILRDWDGNLPIALQQAGDLSVTTIQGLTDSVRQRR